MAISSQIEGFSFQPTEADRQSCLEVDETCKDAADIAQCQILDIDQRSDWQRLQSQRRPFDAVLAFNVVHIVPWSTVRSLFQAIRPGNGILPKQTGRLILYGAFNENGRFTSEGNRKVSE